MSDDFSESLYILCFDSPRLMMIISLIFTFIRRGVVFDANKIQLTSEMDAEMFVCHFHRICLENCQTGLNETYKL